MRLVTYRDAAAVTIQLFSAKSYGSGQEFTLRMGILLTTGLDASDPPLEFGDTLSLECNTGDLDVTVFAIEMTVGSGADV